MAKKNAVATTDKIIIVDELVTDAGRFEIVPMNQIRISKTNRKHFNQVKLTELAESIKEMGVAQPILIRPVTPTKDEPQQYEIVAGERRFRASQIAGMTTIPAMIRTLTDLQAAKIQILENLQREDPHELEEALGYQALMLAHGYSADQLVGELKKSRSYIYGRLKLCALAEPLHNDFLDQKFSASIALLVARIPVPSLQVKAMREILDKTNYEGQMSFRDAKRHIEMRYMLKLADAKFDIKDNKLTDAPNCVKCPKRTGNQPEIFDDVDPNVCTDPDCFAEKKAATVTAKIRKLEKQNIRVFTGAEVDQVFAESLLATGTFVSKSAQLRRFARLKDRGVGIALLGTFCNADFFPEPVAYVVRANGEFVELYYTDNIQEQLESSGICNTLPQALENNAHKFAQSEASGDEESDNTQDTVTIGAATLSTVSRDAYAQKLKIEQERKDRAAKETLFRVALYKKIREQNKSGLRLISMKEVVKALARRLDSEINEHLIDLYPNDSTDSIDSMCDYIDQASFQNAQLLLLDLTFSDALTVSPWAIDSIEHDDIVGGVLRDMAKAAGIDADKIRAEVKKKTVAPTEAWSFPTPDTQAVATK